MIKINLTPVEELENQFWWALDGIVFAASILGSLGLVMLYLYGLQIKIDDLNSETSQYEQQYQRISSDIRKYDNLDKKVGVLETKKNSLQRITKSKLVRYLPIIIIENLQNLRPRGLWFTKLQFVNSKKENSNSNEAKNDMPVRLEIEGGSLSNSIIAEFMVTLKSTRDQDPDPDDIRTQVFFNDVNIGLSQLKSIQRGQGKADITLFKLILGFEEREVSDVDRKKLTRFIETFEER